MEPALEVEPATEETKHGASNALADIAAFLKAHPTPSRHVRLCADDDEVTTIEVPAAAIRIFVDILAQMAEGRTVTVVPVHAEMTTQQAADLLNVSRPYLVGLLEDGAIPFRLVGNRRRVRSEDLAGYRRADDTHRRQVLEELTAEAEKLGLGY